MFKNKRTCIPTVSRGRQQEEYRGGGQDVRRAEHRRGRRQRRACSSDGHRPRARKNGAARSLQNITAAVHVSDERKNKCH